MPCSDDEPPRFEANKPTHDWGSIHPYTPKRTYAPETLTALVATILDGSSGKMKAVGSNYSLSEAQVPDDFLIRTSKLGRHLSQPHPAVLVDGVAQVIGADRLASPQHNKDWLQHVMHRGMHPAPGNHLVHVQAGVKIKDLLVDLAGVNLALPTMGAGGGQSLAGALSTGTHGSDIDLPPLFDFARAVHLVGPGGQEWWIEPANGMVGGPNLATLPGWCAETRVVRDDDWFRAALLTIGRLGVVYSMVLEVPEQYGLRETTEERPWSSIRGRLNAGANGDYFETGGEFNASFEGEPLRFYSAVIDLAAGETCWVTRRWKTTDTTPVGLESDSSMDSFLCSGTAGLAALVGTATIAMTGLAAQALAVPVVGLAWSAAIGALHAELLAMAAQSATVGDFLVKVFAKVNSLDVGLYGPAAPELQAIVRALGAVLLRGAQTDERRGLSHQILDTHDYNRDGCMSGNSTEIFFDASSPAYLSFVDSVLAAAQDMGPLPGYVSLRFVRGSQALMAMERFPLTVAVEVAVARSLSNDQFPVFMLKVDQLAIQHGGIPHWGQEHVPNAQRVQDTYGDSLEAWRWVVSELELMGPPSFTSTYCNQRGLDPVAGIDEARAQRLGGLFATWIAMAG